MSTDYKVAWIVEEADMPTERALEDLFPDRETAEEEARQRLAAYGRPGGGTAHVYAVVLRRVSSWRVTVEEVT